MNELSWDQKRFGTVYHNTIRSLDAKYIRSRHECLVGVKGVTNIKLRLAGG